MKKRTGPPRRPLADRFWERVNRRGADDCWLWTGYLNNKGYGQIALGGHCSPAVAAHRVSWEFAHGTIPAGAHVLHKCDVPACVNPAHLYLGTHDDNMADMKRKGRANGGPGPLTVPLDFVNSYPDRYGKPRYYFRCKEFRMTLPDPSSPAFRSVYNEALARRERLRNLTTPRPTE